MNDCLDALLPLMRQKSDITDPEEFQSAINVIFHDHEAKYYDKLHSEMWESLPQQYELMINDISKYLATRSALKLLDVGCGTGLATKMLMDTSLNSRIGKIYLLDTSSTMLKKAAKRLEDWKDKFSLIHGDLNMLNERYDFIVISSVLHHIPDLKGFMQKINGLQNPGGIILTIHDPAAESLHSEKYMERCLELQNYHTKHPRTTPLKNRIINKIKRTLQPIDYIDSINKALIKSRIVNTPLTAAELWSVTDIHVGGLPYSANDGISLVYLTNCLPTYKLLSHRTYAFFGTPVSNLSDTFKKQEQELILARDKYGRHFASVWIKN